MRKPHDDRRVCKVVDLAGIDPQISACRVHSNGSRAVGGTEIGLVVLFHKL